MDWPQYVWIVLAGISLGAGLVRDGQPKTGKHSFVVDLIAVSLGAWILWCGGFFG